MGDLVGIGLQQSHPEYPTYPIGYIDFSLVDKIVNNFF